MQLLACHNYKIHSVTKMGGCSVCFGFQRPSIVSKQAAMCVMYSTQTNGRANCVVKCCEQCTFAGLKAKMRRLVHGRHHAVRFSLIECVAAIVPLSFGKGYDLLGN